MLSGLAAKIAEDSLAWMLWHEPREGFVIEDAKGVILAASPSFSRMLGYSPGELVNRDWQSITVRSDVQPGLQVLEDLLAGKVASAQMTKEYRHKSGYPVRASTRVVKCPAGVSTQLGLPSGTVLVFVGVLTEAPLLRHELTMDQKAAIVHAAVGEVLVANWSRIAMVLAGLIGIVRIDDVMRALANLFK